MLAHRSTLSVTQQHVVNRRDRSVQGSHWLGGVVWLLLGIDWLTQSNPPHLPRMPLSLSPHSNAYPGSALTI